MQRGKIGEGHPLVVIEQALSHSTSSSNKSFSGKAKNIQKISVKFKNDEEFQKWITVLIKASKPELIAKLE